MSFCPVDTFVKPGERLIGIGMFANIIRINILQVVFLIFNKIFVVLLFVMSLF